MTDEREHWAAGRRTSSKIPQPAEGRAQDDDGPPPEPDLAEPEGDEGAEG